MPHGYTFFHLALSQPAFRSAFRSSPLREIYQLELFYSRSYSSQLFFERNDGRRVSQKREQERGLLFIQPIRFCVFRSPCSSGVHCVDLKSKQSEFLEIGFMLLNQSRHSMVLNPGSFGDGF